ncbi:MAG: Na+/H+ antiporter NhaC family protein [Peptostreptococcaceae bacterium]
MEKVKISKWKIYSTLFFCIAPIVMCILMNISLVYAFLVGICYVFFSSIKNGFEVNEVKQMILDGVWECRNLYVVILLIGAMVSVWISSGVVPTMIYYGLEYMKGMNFLFAAFLFVGMSSIFMGTAVGTISTMGVALLGIGKGFNIPVSILVGAVVSGAFLADKLSPISGLLNLTLTTTNTNYKDIIKSELYTIVPTIIISALIYYIIGLKYQNLEAVDTSMLLMNSMKAEFNISIYILILPIVIIILSFIGLKSTYCMSIGLIIGIIVSVVFQNTPLVEETLVSGGVRSMIEVVFIVIGAISLSNMLQGTGVIESLTENLIIKIKSKKDLIIKTGIISSILTVITCDQTMGIVLPSKLLKEKYEEMGVEKSILARTISDTGTIIAPLMSWNVNSLIITLVTGVSCISYAPFAVLCFLAPLITIIVVYRSNSI